MGGPRKRTKPAKRRRNRLKKRKRNASRSRSRKRVKFMRPVRQVQSKVGSHVIRSYESERISFGSDPNATQSGYGFSLRFSYDAKNNTPQIGICRGYDMGLESTPFAAFPGTSIHSDFINHQRIYRYCKVRKMTMHVSKVPHLVIEAFGSGANNIRDPGTDTIIPWAAQPDLINYQNGEFSTRFIAAPDMWKRYKYALHRQAGASGNKALGESRFTVVPRQVTMLPQQLNNQGQAVKDPQIRMKKTPPVDAARFRSSLGSLTSAGWIWIWHHPGLRTAGLQLRRDVWFTVELEYFGLMPVLPVQYGCEDMVDGPTMVGSDCNFGRWVDAPLTGDCPVESNRGGQTGGYDPCFAQGLTGGIDYHGAGGYEFSGNVPTGPGETCSIDPGCVTHLYK